MTDKDVNELENLDEMNPTVDTSSSSKESEPENVDAIKKYIEEQEILLRLSCSNDLPLHQKEKDYKLLEQQSNSCQVPVTNSELKRTTIISCPSIFNSESIHSEETNKSTLQHPSSNDSVLTLESEESLTNQAAANLLSFSQSCAKMQANVKQSNHSDEIKTNIHESCFKTSVTAISECQNEELCDELDINQQVDSKTNDENNMEFNSSNIFPKTSENKLLLSMKNKVKSESFDNLDGKKKSMLVESSIASDLEKNSMLIENDSAQPNLLHKLLTSTNKISSEVNKPVDLDHVMKTAHENKEHPEETLAIATSVMDMILDDAEAALNKKKVCSVLSKQSFSPEKANSSVSLAIGSKVEAKDFCELWHPAQIVEVDCEEMEVLVQYDNQPKMHNEWISISSPRLRPINSLVTKPLSPPRTPTPEVNTEPKVEDKQKNTFVLGERCLARWRDNRRFIATVQNDLGNGNYEVMFDDGFQWKCTLSRLYKLKDCGQQEYPQFGAPAPPAPLAAPAPAPSPATAPVGLPRLPLYHTHLFDPTRDYLGSKSERREMKRKLNIKEIFNIGQKRKKMSTRVKQAKTVDTCIKEEIKSEASSSTSSAETAPATIPTSKENSPALQVKKVLTNKPPVKKKPISRKKIKLKNMDIKPEIISSNDIKKEIPEAVASIIGTVCKTETEIAQVKLEPTPVEIKDSNANDIKPDEPLDEQPKIFDVNTMEKRGMDVVVKEETNLFEIQDGVEHEEVIGKIKEAIIKLEDGINEVEKNDTKAEEIKEERDSDSIQPIIITITPSDKEKPKKSSKVKKGKKLRLMQEKKVKKQVAKVKCQLEEMKKQVEAMRQEIMLKTEELASSRRGSWPADEAALLPGEWCCRWEDGQPVGDVSEAPAPPAPGAPPRRSVQVEDKRLPPGWTKHMVRRSLGTSAGKWDVVLVSPENRRFHTKNDMRVYLENIAEPALKPFQAALMDFGIHLKLSRRLGWVRGAPPASPPLLKRAKLSLNRNHHKLMHHKTRPKLKIKPLRPMLGFAASNLKHNSNESNTYTDPSVSEEATLDGASIKDGFVDVGSLRVQVIETLLRCPAEGCFKNFRNTTLLKMHIKHYHRELRKAMGNTPKVLDLAYARTRPTEAQMKQLKREAQQRIIKVKLPRMHKRTEEQVPAEVKAPPPPPPEPAATPPPAATTDHAPPKPLDSPKLRNALVNKPPKRPRVLLPVRNKEPEPSTDHEPVADDHPPIKLEHDDEDIKIEPKQEIPDCGVLDFETAISTYTVAKIFNGRSKGEKRRKTFAVIGKMGGSEDEEWAGAGSDVDTRSSYPSCGTPDSKGTDARASSPSDDKDSNHLYMYTENGERIKLVRMKREEIINCHCGFREEDGLMVQCELCLCWQHALCHNIQREAEVPEKYTCSICLNPRRGRRRQRFTHDQDRLYEGLLPGPGGGRACDALRRAHELSGNLLRIEDALHAVRVNISVAQTKNHPKLYLWARDWETVELSFAQEKLNSEYSDLNVIINNLGKENLPIKVEDLKEMALDMRTPSSEELEEKHSQRENLLGSEALVSGPVSSPGAAALELPVGESELEKLAKSVHEHESAGSRVLAPQPEAAIENGACRARLLRHIQRCHALLDQRLDSIEAQVAELESQDASLEDDETADYYPRTKQTMVMVARDLDAMEELGLVT